MKDNILIMIFGLLIVSCNLFDRELSGKYLFSMENGSLYNDSFIELEQSANNDIFVNVAVKTECCSGQFKGKGKIYGNTISAFTEFENDSCNLQISVNGMEIQVKETDCMNWHGFRCSFQGRFIKQNR